MTTSRPSSGLAQLYAAVRNAYAEKVGFVADLAYKTRRLIEENATQTGLGRLTKSVTFDVKTLEALRRREGGPDEGKVFNLVRGLQKEIDDDAERGARASAAEGSRRAHPEGPRDRGRRPGSRRWTFSRRSRPRRRRR